VLLHLLFEPAVAYEICHVPPHACEDDVLLEMRALKLIMMPPLDSPSMRGEIIAELVGE
jgi:hypothetical protein